MPRVIRREIARPSRMKLMLRRQRRMLRPLSLSLVSFALVMAGLVVVHSARSGGTAARLQRSFEKRIDLRVQTITIDGLKNTPEPLLRAALGVNVGDPILAFSVEEARARIEGLSWIEHVAVERRLPGTIYVAIAERRPFAIWQSQGKFLLIDRDGQIVTNEDVAAFGELPLVVGAGAPAHAAALLDLLTNFPDVRDHVTAMVRVGDRRWNLQLKNGMVVMLPEGHEDAACKRLHELQTSQDMLDRPLISLDLRLADRLAVRSRQGVTTVTPVTPPDTRPADTANRRAT
jgi:cell division protein FtsQ